MRNKKEAADRRRPLAYVTLDKDGRILECNRMAAKMLGVERKDLVGTNFAKLMTVESLGYWYLHCRAGFSNDVKQVCEIRIRRADGTLLSVRAESIGTGYGSDGHCRTVLVDITEQKRTDEEREQLLVREQSARKELDAATKAKDRFISMVSHELRTPLTPILGWARLLKDKALNNATLKRGLESIERNAKLQKQLIDNLLDLSDNIGSNVRVKFRPVDLRGIINAATDTVRSSADAKAIQIQTQFDEDARLASGEPDNLQRLIFNLLSNAVKFTPHGGRINVQLQRVDSHIQIVVSDTGIGIPKSFLPYVFAPFSHADDTSIRAHGGLGLGLAIVRQIVEMHGGTAQVRSEEGFGATFTIRLPIDNRVIENPSAARAKDGIPHSFTQSLGYAAAFEGWHILVVEDEPNTLEMLTAVLETARAEVRVCTNLTEALQAVREWEVDALISDLDTSDGEGYALVTKVRELEKGRRNHVRAIALTAHVQAQDRKRAFRAGFDGFVAKPIAVNDLFAAVSGRLRMAA